MSTPHTDPQRPRTRRAAILTAFALSTFFLVLGGVACGDLAGLLGPTGDKVQCNITGTAVGFDGGEVNKVDLNFYPSESAGTSETIEGSTDGADFMVTALVVPMGSTQVEGELAVGEAPTPPLPLKYGQTRIELDLPAGDCNMDLGEVVLPAKGSDEDQTGDPVPGNNSTNNDGGTNNDDGSNNDSPANNDGGTNNDEGSTNDGT